MKKVETKEQSIQMSLYDYFMDSGAFTLEEANDCVLNHYNRDVKIPSIRARIYEGIDRGLFKRVAKGVFIANTEKNNCLLIQGNGRDLSFIEDNSIDALICDHPYDLKKSHKGGNRNLVSYDAFRYDVNDFKEKYRVLKPGGFMIEMLPERNSDNIEYLNEILELARTCNYKEKIKRVDDKSILIKGSKLYEHNIETKVNKEVKDTFSIEYVTEVEKNPGFEFYAVVPWEKGDFIINQGRKSKNTEDIYFFTKGKARSLKLDNKKNLALAKENNLDIKSSSKSEDVAKILKENGIEPCYMSGTNGMLPTTFNHQSPSKKERIHQAEKPVSLYQDIIHYVTLEGERILDQYGGSGNSGKAALKMGRDAIVIENDEETFEKMVSSYEEFNSMVKIHTLEEYEKNKVHDFELDIQI